MSTPGLIMRPYGGVRLSPLWLERWMIRIFGADLIGLYIGEDIILDVSNDVTSWPGRIGSTMVNNNIGKFKTGNLNGRRALLATAGVSSQLSCVPASIVKSVLTVLQSPALPFPPPAAASVCVGTLAAAGINCIMGNGGTNQLVFDTWVHYVKNLPTDDVSTGVAVYRADKATNASAGLNVGYFTGATYPWLAPQGSLIALSAVQIANKYNDATACLNEYYRMR